MPSTLCSIIYKMCAQIIYELICIRTCLTDRLNEFVYLIENAHNIQHKAFNALLSAAVTLSILLSLPLMCHFYARRIIIKTGFVSWGQRKFSSSLSIKSSADTFLDANQSRFVSRWHQFVNASNSRLLHNFVDNESRFAAWRCTMITFSHSPPKPRRKRKNFSSWLLDIASLLSAAKLTKNNTISLHSKKFTNGHIRELSSDTLGNWD